MCVEGQNKRRKEEEERELKEKVNLFKNQSRQCDPLILILHYLSFGWSFLSLSPLSLRLFPSLIGYTIASTMVQDQIQVSIGDILDTLPPEPIDPVFIQSFTGIITHPNAWTVDIWPTDPNNVFPTTFSTYTQEAVDLRITNGSTLQTNLFQARFDIPIDSPKPSSIRPHLSSKRPRDSNDLGATFRPRKTKKSLLAKEECWNDLPDWGGRTDCPLVSLPEEILNGCFALGRGLLVLQSYICETGRQ